MYKVPFVDPRTHYRRLKPKIDEAIITCLTNGDLIYRQQLKAFEEKFASFVGCKYAVGVNSGYHALHFSLRAAGIGPGNEVITVAHTFVATVSAIVNCGAKAVLIDVGEDYNMAPERIEPAITSRTKALLPVHLNGRVCEMEPIMKVAEKYNLVVIEDPAQAVGASYDGKRAGSFGLAGCFSFYPFKVLGCFGDGGAVTTDDPGIAREVSLLRYNGEDRETGEYHCHGYTALLDNVQAAVLDVKLPHLGEWIQHRRHIAGIYREGLEGVGDLKLPHFDQQRRCDIYQNYVIRTKRRNDLRKWLKQCGVETLIHWPKPMWEHKGLGLENPGLKNTERLCGEVLSLPMSAETTAEHVGVTTSCIRDFFSQAT